jgi:tryptophan-rich sensory protein
LLSSNKYLIFPIVFAALILGGLSSTGAANDLWYVQLNKSSLNPPGYVFGIVWPILYVLMSISAYRTFPITINLFYLQLFFNAIWSWLFFAFQLPFLSLLCIWLLIVLNSILNKDMFKYDRLSSYLYTPYIVWLLFASYLNLYIVLYN